jgi:DNA-binding IclR family transcriptional regulator
MSRGRPRGQLNPARSRVLTYWRKHGPCPLQQVVRATGVERSRLKRIMLALKEMGEVNYSPMHKAIETR